MVKKEKDVWFKHAYRRNVIDMHITDWNEKFMSEFDPKKYVEMLALSQVKSAVVYAHSHTGLCYFPTKIGQMHRGLKGRNILAEVIKECHKKGINLVVYVSLIFDGWAFNNHPDWRIIYADGTSAEKSRYGVCCPNSPYREYAAGIAREICAQFDFEGIRFDMTFWPTICYCPHCQKRFAKEVGGALPKITNWEDPGWVSFQRKREEWLVDFAAGITSTVKKLKPEVSVEHQASTYPAGWVAGVTHSLAKHNDFLQGDFYGDALQGSFVRKLLYNLSENLPYGFETSICADLGHHTALKSPELLRAKAYAAIAGGGSFIFIDAIDPVGTLNPAVYKRMGKVFAETKTYEPYLGGDLIQDVAIYLSTESKCDFADNGKKFLSDPFSSKLPHVDGAVSVCKTLLDKHIPFGVITKKKIGSLSDYQTLILPNVLMMDKEETDAVREYVRSGGFLYASKYTSLITKDGVRQKDFLLSDVFGCSYLGETTENFTYIAPEKGIANFLPGAGNLFENYSAKYPLGIYANQIKIKASPGTKILGCLVLPYTNPSDTSKFASIHSNPPGIVTDRPAMVFNKFGKGKVIYVAGDIENSDSDRNIFYNLLRLLSKSFHFELEAPKSVEITVFHQVDKGRYLINLLNFQKELPNIPVDGIKVRLKVGNKRIKKVMLLPGEKRIPYKTKSGHVEFITPRLETFLMLAVDYSV